MNIYIIQEFVAVATNPKLLNEFIKLKLINLDCNSCTVKMLMLK